MSNLIVPGLAFAIASSPATYKLTRKVAGPWIANFEGVATPAGLFLHTLFFLFVLYLVGRFMPRMSGYMAGSVAATCRCPSGYRFNACAEEGHRCEPMTSPAPTPSM